jgi:hypothetical protein
LGRDTLIAHLGIELLEAGDDFLKGAHAGGCPDSSTGRRPSRRRLGRFGGDFGFLGRDLLR